MKRKEAQKYVFEAPAVCGEFKVPTKPPVPERKFFESFADWKKYCRNKMKTPEDCKSCGGRWREKKDGVCKVQKSVFSRLKCRKVTVDICDSLGCVVDSSGRFK